MLSRKPSFRRSDPGKILADLEANEAAVDRMMNGLRDVQLNWHASPRSWSIAQCIDHVARSNRDYIGGARRAVERVTSRTANASAPIETTLLERLFLWVVEPPARLHAKSPKSALPSVSVDPADAKAALLKTHDEIRALIREARGLNLNRILFPNPFFRPMPIRVGTAFLIVAAHERRHIWQANNVRKALDAACA